MKPTIDLSSKRSKMALRFFTYGVMTVTTVVLTSLLIMVALGYQFNRTDLSFTQGGLVQLRSYPADATVTIDDKAQTFNTPGKVNLESGHHTITMARKGYHQWDKNFNLAAGQLVWFNYARLIPQDLKTNTLREFDSLHSITPSPNRRWLLLQTAPNSPSFTLVDYQSDGELVYETITLPDSQLTRQDGNLGTFEPIEWDLDSRFVLIKHQLPGSTEFIRLDRSQADKAVNLSRLFGLNIAEAHFAGNSADIVFAKTDTVLRRLDIGSSSASGALAANLRNFVVYGSGSIAFTQEIEQTPGDSGTKAQQIAIYHRDKIVPVRTVPFDQQVIFDYNEYDDHTYLAIGEAFSSKVEVIRDPTEQGQKDDATIFASLDLGAPLAWLSFSGNGRMVVAQNGNRLASYDLEEAKAYHRDLDFGATIERRLRWLDDYYLWTNVAGRTHIVEFDGTNHHQLAAAEPSPLIMLSADGVELLSIGRSDKQKPALQATQLTIKE